MKNTLYQLRALLLPLVLLLCGSGSWTTVHAQTDVTIGSGTATATYLPIYTYYGYNYTQTIYTAAELNAGGAGSTASFITKIRWKPSTSQSTATWKDWVVYLGNTPKEGFASTTDWVALGSLSEVFNGVLPVTSVTSGTWVELTLATPFLWDGTSNLVVAVDENTPSYGSSGSNWFGYTLAPSTGSKAIYYYNDGTNPNPSGPPTANNITNDVAQIQFEMTPASACTGTPTGGTATATMTSLCVSGSTTLNLTGQTNNASGITIQWEESSNAGGPFTPVSTGTGGTTTSYNTGTISATTYYRAAVTCASSGQTGYSNVQQITVNNPSLTGTTPGSRCGVGTVNLSASASGGNTVNWYSAPTGGTPLFTGNNFTTPPIATTTTFYAAATSGGSTTNVGKASTTGSDGYNTGTNSYLIFTAMSNFTLNSVVVYPYGTNNSPGTITIALQNSAGTTLQSTTVNVTAYNTPTPQTVPVNFNVTPGTDYRLNVTAFGGSVTGMYRDYTSVPFPYTLPGVVSITNGSLSGYYYYFYNWEVSTGCEGTRTPVVATVTAPPALSITADQTVCNGGAATLSVTSGSSSFDTYSWTPTTGLFTDAGGTTPYTGGNQSTVYAISSTAGTSTYALTATNSGTSCANTDTTVVTVLPDSVAIQAAPSIICNAGATTLSLSPATGYGAATFQWQQSANGSTFTNISGATSASYNTGTISASTYYRVQISNSAGAVCLQPQILVNVQNILPPTSATATPNPVYVGQPFNLSAISAGNNINWYTTPSGGTAIGSTLSGGNLSQTKYTAGTYNYYAEANSGSLVTGSILNNALHANVSSGNWTLGYSFTPSSNLYVTAVRSYFGSKVSIWTDAGTLVVSQPVSGTPGSWTETPLPTPVTLTAGTTYRIGAFTNGGNYYWYDPVGTSFADGTISSGYELPGDNFPTSTDQNQWLVDITYGEPGCVSATRTLVSVTVNGPEISSTTPGSSCGPGSVTLSATASPTGAVVNWFDVPTGGTSLFTGNTFTTPSISTTTTYYAEPSLPGASSATLGAGANTSTNYDRTSPFEYHYGNYKHQMLILASELIAQGLTAGQLTSVAFDVVSPFSGSTYATLNNFTVSVKQTTATALTTTYETGTTEVYTGNYTPTTGINTFTFSTPFAWDGTSNIIIQTCYNNNNSGNNATGAMVTFDVVPFNAHAYYYVDGTANTVCGTATASGVYGSRPKMIIGATGGITGPRVAVVANIGAGVAITTQPTNETVCEGSALNLSIVASGADGYQWYRNGVAIPGATNATYTVGAATAANAGTYYVAASLTGCGSTNSDTVTVTVTPTPSATIGYTSASYCIGAGMQSVAQTGTTGGSYSASPTGLTINATTGEVDLANSTPGTYTITYTVAPAGGCAAYTTTTTMTVTPPPTITAQPVATAICEGEPLTLSVAATGGTTYQWYHNTNPIPGATSSTYTVANAGPAQAGSYYVVINECATSTTVMVDVEAAPTAGTINVNAIVPSFTFSSTGTSGATTYLWLFGDGNSANTPTAAHTYTSNGVFTVSFIVTNSCGATDTVTTSVTVTNATSVGNVKGLSTLVQVYPNPSSGLTVIEADGQLVKAVEVMDNLGRVVLHTQPKAKKAVIDVKGLAQGIYTLRIHTATGLSIAKLQVQ